MTYPVIIHFFITPDKRLNIKIIQRSGDLIFGVSNINIFEFSLLQDIVLSILQREVDSQIKLGYLHHSITNLHIYEDRIEQARDIFNFKERQITDLVNDDEITFLSSLLSIKILFCEIVSFLDSKIIDSPHNVKTLTQEVANLKNIFDKHSIKIENNLLWGYAEAALSYIYQVRFDQPIALSTKLSYDFSLSVNSNYFNSSNKGNL